MVFVRLLATVAMVAYTVYIDGLQLMKGDRRLVKYRARFILWVVVSFVCVPWLV